MIRELLLITKLLTVFRVYESEQASQMENSLVSWRQLLLTCPEIGLGLLLALCEVAPAFWAKTVNRA